MSLQVMPAGLKPSQPPPEGVFLSGLHLHNALWDLTRAVMMLPTPDSPSTQEMPLFWLKPLETSAAGAAQTPRRLYQLYKCPVFCARDRRHQGDRNIVVHFSLPTLCDPAVWQYQRVFLTTSLMQAAN
ncbi:hypothetical protein DPMN_059067 [Dreissena polymorpha]|uniref:Dynein heavy chain C-terminal domain-containing protein n=1 Tax=Dreissena polymorpha TaxID=45954 RepID=A0A9D4HGW2_DREPO|nr:hypothetical protein DPMN_059058 [Dreissena polymorpha]KAH3716346.1 hypothetical protein DPMN_059067 [Dreissena polymorpha]